ncbi:MAG: hypothetical protein RRZ24_01080 [Clostridia bacterium]
MINTFEQAGNSILHDFEFKGLKIDYTTEKAKLFFVDTNSMDKEIVVSKLVFACFEHSEKWGKGRYVVSSQVDKISTTIAEPKIVLNSGDTISIRFTIT